MLQEGSAQMWLIHNGIGSSLLCSTVLSNINVPALSAPAFIAPSQPLVFLTIVHLKHHFLNFWYRAVKPLYALTDWRALYLSITGLPRWLMGPNIGLLGLSHTCYCCMYCTLTSFPQHPNRCRLIILLMLALLCCIAVGHL